MAKEKTVREVRPLPKWAAILPILTMVILMVYDLVIEQNYEDAHLPLVVAMCVAVAVGVAYGRTFKDIMAAIVARISNTLEAILILMTVGFLVASFMAAGTIPALIYYGLKLLSPKVFLPVGCLLCGITGLACGSSWTTTATMGVAFMGIGLGLGINPALTAGMVISGAYVGDKFSPLSDTTNLAAGVSNTGLFDHVRAMVSTTGPTMILALVLYTIFGLRANAAGYDDSKAVEIMGAIADNFNLNVLVFLPLIVIIIVCVVKMPALPGILLAVVVAVLTSMLFQRATVWPDGVTLGGIFNLLHYGGLADYIETSSEDVNAILGKAGGMDGTMWTINLVILAVGYGGALEGAGVIDSLFAGIKDKLHKPGQLVIATMLTGIFCDAALGDQFLGISVPAPLYADKFDEMGLARNMMSRTLEDAGTLWSPMFPWTACGAWQSSVLGMSPFAYFPFAFVNLLNPFYAAITASLGRNIFWADGSYTNLFGKTKAGDPAEAPEAEHEIAVKNLEALREAGKAPKIGA